MIDFRDPAFLDDPYPTLAEVREATPIFPVEDPKGRGATLWFLTRYDDVYRALRDRRLGRIKGSTPTPEELGIPSDRPDLAPYFEVEQWSLLMLEPPEHTRLRRLVAGAFTPKRIEGLRPAITGHADRFLDEVVGAGPFDLLTQYAQPYSVHVIAELLGVPTDDWRSLLDWSHAIVKMYELDRTEEQVRAAVQASREFTEWCRELIADRRARPRDDLVTDLVTAETEDGRLTDDEIVSTIILLLNAGHEATVNTLGNGVTALMEHRDQWRALVEGRVDARTAVEELIRFDPPLQLFERWVREEGVVYGGREIPVGDKLAMLFGSANRDPRHFPHPDRFDVARGDSSHITFGGGIHYCLGAPLARLELDVALSRLVARAPGLDLVEPPRRNPTFVIHGYEAVRVVA
ncbi:MAG TPA: cytochrome P450 [Actinobacteria bacterium]|nr:cytochrome P450 [Actinomycetota bacterium]